MGFIEEGRQLIQDFVTPEIRAIEVKIDAVEKKIDALEARIDKRFETVERRFDATDAKIERGLDQVTDSLRRMEIQSQILERLARRESKLQHVA